MSSLAPVVIPASVKHTATIIFLHGLGDTGHGWASSLGEVKPPYAKVVCPTASSIPVSLNGGLRMPSWFDLRSLDANAAEDEEGIKKASNYVKGLITQETEAGIPANRIIIGGFSMGGALALYTGLTGNVTVGGVVALSSWLPLHKKFNWENIKKPAIFQGHGDSDPLVLHSFGLLSSQLLKQHVPNAEFKTYPGLQHSSSEAEMEDLKNFVKKIAPAI